MSLILNHRGSQNRNEAVLITSTVLMCIFYAARDILLVAVPESFFIGISLLAFSQLSVGYGLSFYIFTSMLTLPGNPIRLLYILITLYKLNKCGRCRISVAMIGVLLLQLFDMVFYSIDGIADILYLYVEKMLYIVVPMLWLSSEYKGRDVQRAVMYYVLGAVFAFSVFLMMTVQGKGIDTLLSSTFRFGFRSGVEANATMASSYNANAIGTVSAVGISYLLALMDRKTVKKRTALLLSVPLVLFVLLSRSRTAILLLGVMLVVMIYYYTFSRRKIGRGIAIIAVAMILLGLLYRFFPTVVEQIINRFNAEDISNGRTTINSEYLEKWLSEPMLLLFGYGIGNYVRLSAISISNSAHNAIVDILMCWGITGLMLLATFMVTLWRRSRTAQEVKCPLIAYLPMLLSLISIQGGQYLTTGLPHIKLSLSIMFLYVYADQRSIIQDELADVEGVRVSEISS